MTVWDAFWFNDETDLLAWRLQLLKPVVDRVLLVEGDRTFTGTPKDSVFAAHAARFASLGAPIEHVVVALPDTVATPGLGGAVWDRENAQRAGMARALDRLAAPGDLILAGDVDEVPRPNVVATLATSLDRPVRLHLEHANYYANWVQPRPWMNSLWAFRHGQQADHPMLRVHFGVNHDEWAGYIEEYVADAGWHVSFLGGPDAIRAKWAVYSHQEFNADVNRAPGHLERCFHYGVHFQGRILLRRLDAHALDPQITALGAIRPNYLSFDPDAPMVRRRIYRTWTWMRRLLPIPTPVRRYIDDHPSVLFGVLGPFILGLDALLEANRRRSEAPGPHPLLQYMPSRGPGVAPTST